MKAHKRYPALFVILAGAFLLVIHSFTPHAVLAQSASPTPTFDPFAQPPLPPNPSQLELGQYLYWRHCMPCHGDHGQGLTDEFRALWVEDHQNCWARGCHGGKKMDEGFPIPTFVPPIAGEGNLARFDSEQELFDYLKATHPPQYPGRLEEDEYRTLAFFVFWMNHRAAASPTPPPASTPTPGLPPSNEQTLPPSSSPTLWLVAIVAIPALAAIVLIARHRKKRPA